MKISIITVTYNSEKTISSTLESVLKQRYSDYEHIVVDGNSRDETVKIVRSYEPQYKGRLHWISEPDKGMYDAMNKGFAMATGDVIGILNSDDFYTDDDVLQCVSKVFAEDDELEAVYGDVHFVKAEDLGKCTRYYSSRMFSRKWMRFGFMPAHPSFYCKKSAYEKAALPVDIDGRKQFFDTDYKVAADFENLLRVIFVNRIKTKYLKKDFVTMRTGGASTSGLRSHRQIMKDHLKGLRKNQIYSNALMLGMRYPYKIIEIIYSKFRRK